MASFWAFLLFSREGESAIWVGLSELLGGIGLGGQVALTAAWGFWEQGTPALEQEGAVGAAGSPVPVWKGWDSQGHPAHAMSHCGVQLWALQRGISRITGYLCAPSWPHPGAVLCLEANRDGVVTQQVSFRSWNSFLLQHFRAWTQSLSGGVFGGACYVPDTDVLCKVGSTSRDMYRKYTLKFRAAYQKQLRKK